jgi:hypothetical protein
MLFEGKIYQFNRCPQGLSTSRDYFNQLTDAILQGIKGIQKLVDDIIRYAETFKQLMTIFRKGLEAQKANISMSLPKVQ